MHSENSKDIISRNDALACALSESHGLPLNHIMHRCRPVRSCVSIGDGSYFLYETVFRNEDDVLQAYREQEGHRTQSVWLNSDIDGAQPSSSFQLVSQDVLDAFPGCADSLKRSGIDLPALDLSLPLLVMIDPGSLCGPATWDLGLHEARRIRRQAVETVKLWTGNFAILQGDHHPEINRLEFLSFKQDLQDASSTRAACRVFRTQPHNPLFTANHALERIISVFCPANHNRVSLIPSWDDTDQSQRVLTRKGISVHFPISANLTI